MPAAGSVWPIFALREPMSGALSPSALRSAATSVGSPSAVPVPCASSSESAGVPAPPSAARSIAVCAWPFGAVRLAERPSDRTAQLSTELSVAAPSAPSVTAPTASPRT
eukprot:1341673-Pleurochrysis_carterae.AAC.1